MGGTKAISPEERLTGRRVHLRLLTLADCTERYVEWLRDPDVNRFLETRWREQTLESVRAFVGAMHASPVDYLFAIVGGAGEAHVGNLKVGPVNPYHLHADVSYFIGEKEHWGKGYATEAIALAAGFAFGRLGLNRVQAGVYEENRASARALEKAGFVLEGRFRRQLRGGDEGTWQDHFWYGLLADEWSAKTR